MNASPPQDASEVRSFVQLVQYSAKFLPNFAQEAEPLRSLLGKNEPFVWGEAQERSFQKLKELAAGASTLAYFRGDCNTRIIADAGPHGLGAVLTQLQDGEWRAISYASRNLTEVERRYSQTEKEALALVWACERFNIYVYGRQFELETDHKPLECIFGRLSKPSARIERWVLRLHGYDYKVIYRPRKANIADALSRLNQYGYPFTLKSDNGPQFCCEEFKTFLSDHGIEHRTSPPLWPQANGQVERQNRTLLKALKVAHVEGKEWRGELNKFLLTYRSTPQVSTGVTPAFLMFGRELKTKFPEVKRVDNWLNEGVRDNDWNHKLIHKAYADNRRGAVENPVMPGDQVLLKNTKTSGKLEANFESKPYTVQTKEGREVTVRSKEGVEYRRNSSFVKRYNLPEDTQELTENVSEKAVSSAVGEAVSPAVASSTLEESTVTSRQGLCTLSSTLSSRLC